MDIGNADQWKEYCVHNILGDICMCNLLKLLHVNIYVNNTVYLLDLYKCDHHDSVNLHCQVVVQPCKLLQSVLVKTANTVGGKK